MLTVSKNRFKSAKEKGAWLDWLSNHGKLLLFAATLSNYEITKLCRLDDDTTSAMEVDVDHKYLTVHLKYSEAWASRYYHEKNWNELLAVLAHEIAHVVTSEADDKLVFISNSKERSYYFERATEITSRWLYKYYKHYYMPTYKINPRTGQ